MSVYRWLALFACLALSGCASFGEDFAAMFSTKGERDLYVGVKAYEDGEYAYSARLLQASLDAGLRGTSNLVRAHKYLAFIYCTSNRVPQCRDEFRKALEIDPSFSLLDDESGHPIWGPVYRSLKPRKK
jgi:Tfp pilus assembly protein PilF